MLLSNTLNSMWTSLVKLKEQCTPKIKILILIVQLLSNYDHKKSPFDISQAEYFILTFTWFCAVTCRKPSSFFLLFFVLIYRLQLTCTHRFTHYVKINWYRKNMNFEMYFHFKCRYIFCLVSSNKCKYHVTTETTRKTMTIS